jgi:flagellar biosynthesis/type III secretory pathway protein FliH
MTLPKHLEIRYNEEIKQFEEEHHMHYITSIERQGIQQGIQQGRHQGIQQGEYTMLQRLLQRKFNQIPSRYLDKMQRADSETLLKWSDTLLEAKSLAEVFEE